MELEDSVKSETHSDYFQFCFICIINEKTTYENNMQMYAIKQLVLYKIIFSTIAAYIFLEGKNNLS